MTEMILLKLGELVLKGANRYTFEDKLKSNLARRLKSHGKFRVYSRQSTTYIEPLSDECDMDAAYDVAKKVFGAVGVSRAKACAKTKEAMLETVRTYLASNLAGEKTFKVESKRADKSFPMTSIQLSQWVGGELDELYPNLHVDVHNPALTIHLEVRDYAAFVHADPEPGAGGLPVGTSGRAMSLLSGGIDSPVASWMMAKRGVELTAVHFASPPYTSELAREKVRRLLRKVAEYAGRIRFVTVNLTRLQEEIRDKCPQELSTVILRRYMLRGAQRVAQEEGCSALVTGESLGQVASQTIQAIACTDAVATMPVFRPLIGADKSEIVKVAYQIGTYDISIEPYEDCCTIFTPKHPRTKPILHFVEDGERAIEGEALLEEALAQRETEWVYPR